MIKIEISGPKGSGKSTLALKIVKGRKYAIINYNDLTKEYPFKNVTRTTSFIIIEECIGDVDFSKELVVEKPNQKAFVICTPTLIIIRQ